jgi:hypothetical protein
MASARGLAKGCGVALAVWLLLMGAYAYVAWTRIHDPGASVVIGLLGGTAAGMVVSSVTGVFTSRRDRAAIRRAMHAEPMQDGRLEAASGPIRPLGTPLQAPFTAQPCVAYDYDIKRKSGSDYAGFAMTPSAIDTLRGPVRVLGWIMLDPFPAAPGDRIDRNRAVEYLSSAPLESVGLPALLGALGKIITDDDGAIRKDFRIAGEGVNIQGTRIVERSIPAGMAVTMLGSWSEARGGFPPGEGAAMNRLFPGDLQNALRNVSGTSRGTLAAVVAFFLCLHAILVPMYFLAPKSALARAGIGSVWDERNCDTQKTMLGRGADPNEVGSDAITPLMNAARMDEPACVSNLIAAGARLEARDKFSDTALVHAVTALRDDNTKVLLRAGAKEFRVTAASGRRIADGDPPLEAVRNYIAAVHRADFEAMARLREHASVARLEDRRDDLPFWQGRYPQTFRLDEGWMTDDAATLRIVGETKAGPQRIWFHVERVPDTSRRGGSAEAEPSQFWQIRYDWHPDER